MNNLNLNHPLLITAIMITLTACSPQQEPEPVAEDSTESTPKPSPSSPPTKNVSSDDKLDSLLSKLIINSEKKLPEQINSQLSIKNNTVAIEVIYDQPQVTAENQKAFEALGGHIDTVFQNKLYGWIPIDKIKQAAQPKAVWMLSAAIETAYPAKDTEQQKKQDSLIKPKPAIKNGE